MRNLSQKSHHKKKRRSNKKAPKEEFHQRELKLNLMRRRNRLLKMAIRRSKLSNLNELRMKMKTGPKLATRASPGKI